MNCPGMVFLATFIPAFAACYFTGMGTFIALVSMTDWPLFWSFIAALVVMMISGLAWFTIIGRRYLP